MTSCYECSQEVTHLIWNSRCQDCVDRRIAFNRECIAEGKHIQSATEALIELGETP